MITETELELYGWSNECQEGEVDYFFSPKGRVSIRINEETFTHEICIYRDCIDEEGHLASEGAVEIEKDSSLTIQELIQFTQFIETGE